MKKLLIIVLGTLFLIGCKQNQKNALKHADPKQSGSDYSYDWINAKIDSTLTENNIPALSIALIEDGKVTLFEGYGTMERNSNSHVDENSIYQIASQSKMFTGIIVNNLIKEGKLKLDDPITTYLSDVLNEQSMKRLEVVKLKSLLQHTAGIPNDACSNYKRRIDGEAWLEGYSEKELVKDLNEMELEYVPDTRWKYSNSGYVIVGYICEKVSGMDYDALLRNYVTNVYNLDNTCIALNSHQKTLLVTPYRKDNREIKTQPSLMGMATPASALYSTTFNLSKIMVEQIKAYRKNKDDGSNSPLILTEQAAEMGRNDLYYGFGLIMKSEKSWTNYNHGGDADGFGCEYFFSPEKKIGAIFLTSSGGRWIGRMANQIFYRLCNESKN
ncbi:MAG: serine hydrolase domain-containing protein [Bacteroidota bacterium]